MTDEPTSTWPSWESLSDAFKESIPTVDPVTYEAAGQIWEQAVSFAAFRGLDESDARDAMMRTIVKVSRIGADNIQSLPAYLFTSYRRRIVDTEKNRSREQSLEEIGHELAIDPGTALESALLLEEIVARMDENSRLIYQDLILGYSYEEMSARQGVQANVLRSRFSKALKRISNDIREGL